MPKLFDRPPGRLLQITPWERQALQLLANGRSTFDVATMLGMSAPEMETALSTLFAALGAATQAEAIAAAQRRGLLLVQAETATTPPAAGRPARAS